MFWVLLQIVARVRRHVGDAAARPDRHVALVVVLEASPDTVCAAEASAASTLPLFARRPPPGSDPAASSCAVVLPEVAGARQDRVRVPDDLQLRRRLDRVELLRRNHAEEVVHVHDLRIRDVRDRRRVEAHRHVRVVRIRTLAARPHHTAVQHPRNPDVLHVGVLARHLVRDVDPDDRVRILRHRRVRRHRLRRSDARLQRHVRARDVEQLAADQLAVGDGLAAARDDALATVRFATGTPSFVEAMLEQRLARERADVADLRAGARHRVRAALAARADRRPRCRRRRLPPC